MACDERSDRGPIEVLEAELGNVTVELGAEVKADALGNPIGQIRDAVLHQRLDHEHGNDLHEDAKQPRQIARGDVHVHRLLNQRRTNPDQAGQGHHQNARPSKAPAVGTDLGQNHADGLQIEDLACF